MSVEVWSKPGKFVSDLKPAHVRMTIELLCNKGQLNWVVANVVGFQRLLLISTILHRPRVQTWHFICGVFPLGFMLLDIAMYVCTDVLFVVHIVMLLQQWICRKEAKGRME